MADPDGDNGKILLRSGEMAETRRLISLPERAENGNKGSFGCVTVVGGCENYLGAPILCGKAAYRLRAGGAGRAGNRA